MKNHKTITQEDHGALTEMFLGESNFKGPLHEAKRDKQAEIQFLTNALEHFKDTGWINIIQKRTEELKAEK
ncbi:MAG: hypothetical protein GTN76_07565 [Candidatus Aenigmarchaeota archaeon]|nr:hypothetical protein [Candidatus Aenigmarchaeota archaeon]